VGQGLTFLIQQFVQVSVSLRPPVSSTAALPPQSTPWICWNLKITHIPNKDFPVNFPLGHENKRLNTPKTRPSKEAAAAQYAPSRSTGPAVNPLAPGSLPSSAEVVRSLRDHPGNSAARAWQQGSQHESPWVKLEVEQNALKMLKPVTLEDVWHTMLIINWLDDSPLQSRSCVEHLFTAFLYLFLGK
jgi:hypothetical protein